MPDSEVWRRSRGFGRYIDRIFAVTWYNHDAHAGENLCDDQSVTHWAGEVGRIVEGILPIVEPEVAANEAGSRKPVVEADAPPAIEP